MRRLSTGGPVAPRSESVSPGRAIRPRDSSRRDQGLPHLVEEESLSHRELEFSVLSYSPHDDPLPAALDPVDPQLTSAHLDRRLGCPEVIIETWDQPEWRGDPEHVAPHENLHVLHFAVGLIADPVQFGAERDGASLPLTAQRRTPKPVAHVEAGISHFFTPACGNGQQPTVASTSSARFTRRRTRWWWCWSASWGPARPRWGTSWPNGSASPSWTATC